MKCSCDTVGGDDETKKAAEIKRNERKRCKGMRYVNQTMRQGR